MTTTQTGEVIRKLREERGWPQEQLAAIANLSIRTIQRIEAGKPASLESLQALATTFKLDVKDLTPTTDTIDLLPPDLKLLNRVTTGTALVQLIIGAQGVNFAHDDLTDDQSISLAGELFDLIKDWGDIADELPPSKRIELARDLGKQLEIIHNAGLWLFATQIPYRITMGEQQTKITVTNYYLARTTNPMIVQPTSDHPVLPLRIPTPTGWTI